MGCLNSEGKFDHWFANIHLSGPCNRKCYFCIGQHMMGLDSFSNLNEWPLVGLIEFVKECRKRDIGEINLTGTNTDPALYKHHFNLTECLRTLLPKVRLGIRTNGVALRAGDLWQYDKFSVSVCSLNPKINKEMMGGPPADVAKLLQLAGSRDMKVNIILGPQNTGEDLFLTLCRLAMMGVRRVNLREPYGQPRVGDPMPKGCKIDERLGMPVYGFAEMDVTYWDVHYVEVESVNLYANGRVSVTYPITGGYDPELGKVLDQSKFPGGRIQEQWL